MSASQSHTPRFTRRGILAAMALGASAAGLAACAADPDGSGSSGSGSAMAENHGSSPSSSPTPTTPTLTVTSDHGDDAVLPGDTLTITLANATAKTVTVTDPDGDEYTGTLNGSTWTGDRNFWPDTTYTVSVDATSSQNEAVTLTQDITTAYVDTIVYEPVYRQDDLGVGMPVYIQFADTIDEQEHRAAIERAASVTTSPQQEGSWGWVENRILMWRPQEYWQPNSTATVSLKFGGIQVGTSQYLADDTDYTISFASHATVLKCDLSTQHMQVYQDGELLRDCPVSTGKVGHETYDGTKVIMQKFETFTMDSSTYGVPADSAQGYKLEVPNCQRITWSGEFLHSADWSVSDQGVTPTSHGCTNLSPTDAAWLMTVTTIGDPVEFTGTTPGGEVLQFEPHDGVGCWVYDWSSWQQQSALV